MNTVRSASASPMVAQSYKLLQKTQLSHDSFLLKFEIQGRKLLGLSPSIPTCIKVDYPGVDDEKIGLPKVLVSKSYSPVSHPHTEGTFDLIVKSYQQRGGVGKYICDLKVGDSMTATLKKQRIMHGSTAVQHRWKHVGLIAGGTGIAPLLQIARILLESEEEDTKIYLLFINHTEEDILGRHMIDAMAKQHPNQFTVHYSLTKEDTKTGFLHGRGDVTMVQQALPQPTEDDVMIFICGRDGMVAHWAGPVERAPSTADGKKGSKIQGPLLGILAEAGFSANQVFKY